MPDISPTGKHPGVLPGPHGNSRYTPGGVERRNGLMERPSTENRQDALRDMLYSKTQEQYARTLSFEAAKYGVTLGGNVTDPHVLDRLGKRADFAADRIGRTYAKQAAAADSSEDLAGDRAGKAEQIWNYEMGLARHAGLVDFHANHPELKAMVRAEPDDTKQDDSCEDAIELGIISVSEIDIVLPAHPDCPHGWCSVDPEDDPVLADAGDTPDDGEPLAAPVHASDMTADLLRALGWWTAGMAILRALGDPPEQSDPDAGDADDADFTKGDAMATKTVNGEKLPASAFLVVPDESKPSTWALPVRDAQGTPDHGRMGAAWAALHEGYRGQKYDGPDKAAAISKLKLLYKAEGMELPSADMSVAFASELAPAAADRASTEHPDEFVVRSGKIFECGDYPDKAFSFDEQDLANAIAQFEPVDVDLEHVPTVLEGHLGKVAAIYAGEDGKSLMGDVLMPKWLDQLLEDGQRKVSATWDRTTKTLRGLALVRNPRVSDAALMAAFSESEFAGKRHDTRSGQVDIQMIHDSAARGGAVCKRPAAMASRHEASAIQQVHDIAVEHGATCDAVGPGERPMFNTTPKGKGTRMKTLREWITGKAQEDGVELSDDDLQRLDGQPPVELTEFSQALKDREAENQRLREQVEAHEAALARAAEDRRQAEAATFANGLIAAYRITPAAAEKLAPLAARIAATDAVATFADGEKSTMALLQEFAESLVDLSMFTTGQIKPDEAAVIFARQETPGVSKGEAVRDEIVERMLKATRDGQRILAERNQSK